MEKKGFTLVELLAVIVILAVVIGIAMVSLNSSFRNSNDKLLEERITEITTAAINYVQSNVNNMSWENCKIDNVQYDRCKTLTVKQLQDLNLISSNDKDNKIYNSVTNKEMTNDKVTVYRKNNRLQAKMTCLKSNGETC